MTIANTFASKLFVGVVAIAMALSLVAPAQAQTEEEMQSQIDQLMATITALQSQLGQGASTGTASGICPYAWTRSLSSGSTGADVMKLQQFLNADPATRVSESGAGSVGAETQYYGPATGAAVSKFQVVHRDSILTPVGLVNPTGYFGPSTMAAANAQCASAPVMDDSDDDMSDDDDDTMDDVSDLQGEGTLATFEVDDDEDEVQEGDEDAVVMILTLEAEDGDVLVDRLTFEMADAGGDVNDENDPWDVFDEISLWVDGDKIADFEADDEDNYLDEDAGEFRFSGIGLILPEDEEVEVLVAVSVTNSVDGAGDSATSADWELTTTQVRYFDADNVAVTEGDGDINELGDSEIFDIVVEGADDEATIEGNSSTPDASTLLVDDGSTDSDEFVIHIFDIEVDEDSSDLILTDAFLDVTISDPTTNAAGDIVGGQEEVIDGIFMTVDGVTVEGEATTAGTNNEDTDIPDDSSTVVQYLFEFDDLELEGDTDYEVEVSVVFKGQDSGVYDNGTTIEVTADADGSFTAWEVEGLDSDNVLTGSDTSEEHTLVDVVPVITDTDFNVSTNEAETAGTISYEFTIEADGENDLSFDFGSTDATDVDPTGNDLTYTVTGGGGAGVYTAEIVLVSGDATPKGGDAGWDIADGDEATFSVDFTFSSTSAAGSYRVNIDTIGGLEVDENSPSMTLF